ncbi:hypothetical protein ACJW30_01G183500 [Castanea mollissima]
MTHLFKNKQGQGGYGSVYKGKLLDGHLVAVKVINELKVNIVTLHGYCYERTKRALVYEFMPNDLWIRLEYLHRGCSTRILHSDIKPQNILLDEDFCPKISNFGLARLWQRESLGARGTIGYIVLEDFSRGFGGVSHKFDVYSYGMLILEMVGVRKNSGVGMSHVSERYFLDWIYHNLNLGDVGNNMVIIEKEEQMDWKMIFVGAWCIRTILTNRPSMTKVVEMLEGNAHSIEIPPKPFLFSPTRSEQYSSTKSLS